MEKLIAKNLDRQNGFQLGTIGSIGFRNTGVVFLDRFRIRMNKVVDMQTFY